MPYGLKAPIDSDVENEQCRETGSHNSAVDDADIRKRDGEICEYDAPSKRGEVNVSILNRLDHLIEVHRGREPNDEPYETKNVASSS